MSLLDEAGLKPMIRAVRPDTVRRTHSRPKLAFSAMTLRILPIFAACATLTLFSCYPYPEPPPSERPGPQQSVTSPEQQKIEEQRKRLKEEQAELEKKKQEEAGGTVTDPGATKPTVEKRQDYPFATAVPGKEGFVFSPYNNKVVDVRDIPKGTLVQDPTYAASEKKYFRVP
jgi:hypothetical protein